MRLCALLFLMAASAACRTTSGGASMRDTGADPASVHCTFVMPNGTGDKVDIWATRPSSSQLSDVRRVATVGRTGAADESVVGSLTATDAAAITKNGRWGLRSEAKNLADVDFKLFACFDVEGSRDPKRVGFLCLPTRVQRNGRSDSLWLSNSGSLKFHKDLTVYGTRCAAPL